MRRDEILMIYGEDYQTMTKRLLCEAGLDTMVLAGLSRSIAFVLQKNHLIHPDTVMARNEILLKG